MTSYINDPNQPADPTALRSAMLQMLQQRQGYYAPTAPQTPITPQPPEPTGFEKFAQTVGNGLGVLTHGRDALNAIGGFFGNDQLGTNAQQEIEKIPIIGRPLGFMADVATSPVSIGTALLGGGAAGAVGVAGEEAASGLGAAAAPYLWNIGKGVAAAGASDVASNAAKGAGLPVPLQIGAGLLAGAGGFSTVSNAERNLAANATRNIGGLLPDEVQSAISGDDPALKYTALLSEAKPQNDALAAARTLANQERTSGIYSSGFGTESNPDVARQMVASGQAGALPSALANFDPAKAMQPDELLGLRQQILSHYQDLNHPYDYRTAIEAFDNLNTLGKLPTQSETTLITNALGPQFGGVIDALRGQNDNTLVKNAVSLMGVPRALMTIGEMTVTPFKQAYLGIGTGAWRDSFIPMLKSLNDPEFAAAKEAAIRADPRIQQLVENGMHLSSLGTSGMAEEPFYGTQSRNLVNTLLESVPGVQMSRRAMGTYLNSYRSDLATNMWDRIAQGNDGVVAPQQIKSIADFSNLVSGRSNTLKQFTGAAGSNTAATIINNGLFSPQLFLNRIDALNPRTYLSMDSAVRGQAMKTVGAAFGLGLTGLAALGAAGKAGIIPVSIGHDPRNSNFGIGQIGNTKIDLWGGFQPIARYAAQLLSGQAQGGSGTTYDANRLVTAADFVRGKLGPVPSFVVDAIQGQNAVGQPVNFATGQGVDRATAERMAPIFAQNLAEAVKADGYPGLLGVVPPTVLTTSETTSSIRAKGAREMFNGKTWDQLTGQERAKVNDAYAEDLATQEPPGGVSGTIQNIGAAARGQEQQAAAALGTQINNAAFTKQMNDISSARVNQVQGAIQQNGGAAAPPTVLSRYYDLRTQAETNGIVDQMELDQLQKNYYDSLSTDDRRMIDERTSFAHTPEVQWWVDAKDYINKSGYFQNQAKAVDTLQPMLDALGFAGKTAMQIQAQAVQGDPLASAALNRINSITSTNRRLSRVQDPKLDQALAEVYGSRPVVPIR